MINRPPTPEECIPILWWTDWSDQERDSMQEALTCEWLIEQGLMPDPTDKRYCRILKELVGGEFVTPKRRVAILQDWICEDKRK